jgi:uncharacterized protein (TIGR02246 family)
MKITAAFVLLAAALASACFAQSEKDIPPEKAAVLALDREYEAAYSKGDAAALAAFFAEDAEQTTEDGTVLRGRPEIEKSIREGLKAKKGAKLAIALDSVRLLTPEVAVEKGASIVTAKSGETSSSLYTAIYVKKGGNWKISQLIETPQPEVSAHDQLTELEWLVGEWAEADKTTDLSVHSQFVWARGGNFITRNVTVKRAGSTVLEGWQIIGWDPIEKRIRSWTFDGEGGFADGRWTREGERWLVRETGVTPSGSHTTADNTFTKLSADRLTWESNNRTLDGEPQPNIGRIEINRAKGQ